MPLGTATDGDRTKSSSMANRCHRGSRTAMCSSSRSTAMTGPREFRIFAMRPLRCPSNRPMSTVKRRYSTLTETRGRHRNGPGVTRRHALVRRDIGPLRAAGTLFFMLSREIGGSYDSESVRALQERKRRPLVAPPRLRLWPGVCPT